MEESSLRHTTHESATDDEREIYSIILANGDKYYLNNMFTKIECIKEYGQVYYVPWFAVWVGDKLFARINGNYVQQVIYSRQQKKKEDWDDN